MGSVKSYAHKAGRIEHHIPAMGCEFTVMVSAAIVRSAGTGSNRHDIHPPLFLLRHPHRIECECVCLKNLLLIPFSRPFY